MMIPGNQSIQHSLLQKAIESSLGSAYLFLGPAEIGKEAFAVELAKAANSLDTDFEGMMKSGVLKYIHPLPRPKSPKNVSNPLDELSEKQVEELKAIYKAKNKNPFLKIQPEGAGLIKISQIRHAISELHKSTSAKHRFLIIPDAENMNEQAANAFLKTLEEPPRSTTLILTSSKPKKLLQTINSRCQKVIFSSPKIEELEEYALSSPVTANYSQEEIKSKLPYSEASILKLISFLENEGDDILDKSIEFLRLTLRPNNYQISLHNLITKDIKGMDRERFRDFLEKLVKIFSMAKRREQKLDIEYLPDSYLQTINAIGDKFGLKIGDRLIAEVDRSLEMDEVNVGKDMIALDLALRIRQLMLT